MKTNLKIENPSDDTFIEFSQMEEHTLYDICYKDTRHFSGEFIYKGYSTANCVLVGYNGILMSDTVCSTQYLYRKSKNKLTITLEN